MIVNSNNTRFSNYYLYEYKKHQPYDYKNNGLMKRIIPAKVYNTTNPILKWFLGVLDTSLIFNMKYIDKLKHFKNYTNKNR